MPCEHEQVTTNDSTTCPACGADVSWLQSGTPCPACGADALTIHRGVADLVAVSTLVATASVGYSDVPSWDRQWYDLVSVRATIRDYYSGKPMDNQDARRDVLHGCSAAWSLAEHLADGSDRNDFLQLPVDRSKYLRTDVRGPPAGRFGRH